MVGGASFSDTQRKWSFFISLAETSEDGFSLMGRSSISDVRVAPLVKSKWDQGKACGEYCYNYYTPNHYPCGCGATAMAQLMRHHQYPATGIGVHRFTIKVDDVEQTKSTRGGNGNGGPYKWGQMVLEPGCSATLAQRQAIGALCFDAGIATKTEYSASNSTTFLSSMTSALRSTFKYSNSVWGGIDSDDVGTRLSNMANSNLDAYNPVIFRIWHDETEAGHFIVCDGYGYNASTLYHHFNMGWSGSDDAWYNLPNIDHPSFNLATHCIYNIFTSGSGEIISGRVTDAYGSPISGATVTATGQGFNKTHTDRTDSKGIYALAKVNSQSTYTVSVTKSDYTFTSQDVHTGKSKDGDSVSGNRWGVNFRAGLPPRGHVEDFETNNFREFPWEHEGDSHWTTTSWEKHSGNHSAQAGTIDDYGSTTLRVRLYCISGNITFYRKVSSEELSDYLTFYIDGVEKDTWSGDEDWAEVSFTVAAGTRTFEWTYSKDYSVAEGEDTAWIDDIVFPVGVEKPKSPPTPPPPPPPVPPPISNLVGWWKFDEGQGLTAYDSAGNNHGTIEGAQWTIGQVDGALNFDGNDDYVALPENYPIWLPQNNFSLSAWVYFARDYFYHSLSENESILDLNFIAIVRRTNQLGCIIQRLEGSGILSFKMTTEAGDEELYSNEVLAKNTWYHIVAVRDGETQSIYINGRLDANRTCSAEPINFEGSKYDDDRVNIGKCTRDLWDTHNHLTGKIDNVMIFDISLSAAEIQYLFQKII